MKKLVLLLAFVSSALTLTACGGGGGGQQVLAVQGNQSLALDPANGIARTTAVQNVQFAFPAGIPDFGTTGPTTVAFTPRTGTGLPDTTAPAGNPGFAVTGPTGETATGFVEFGSCIFTVQSSTFTSGALVVGSRIVVNPCRVDLDTSGLPADSVSRTRSAFLVLSTAASTGSPVTINVNPGGNFTVNAVSTGTVTLVPLTGA